MAGIGGFKTTLGGSSNFTGTNVISEVSTISLPELSVSDIDVSSMDSAQNYMEFIGGSIDPGQMDLEINYTPAQRALALAAVGDVNETWTLTFPDGSTYATDGYINKNGAGTAGTNEKLSSSLGIKCSGIPTHTTGA